ncbi:hypothetical protein [Halorubrum sp. SP9]|uniref:hypothetical protein n=1 Tax=Halorubrum sp. SP9 TaxID=1537267 RepID=UPI0010F9B492|nr:hypothetical protein [Halorubrum sp. SP9]TKX70795.1 hypothetical protein EXE45_03170 [Halorubrum sp. SP9]
MVIESFAAALPDLSQEMVLILNLVALASLGLFVGLPFVSFKGGAARVNGQFASNTQILVGLAIAVGIVALVMESIETIYDLVILSGYQALGVFMVALPVKIMDETGRSADIILGGCAVLGLLFIFHPAF